MARALDVKALLLSRYERKGASSRVRMFQYEPWLRERGIVPQQEPLLADAYLDGLYSGTGAKTQTLAAYRRRFAAAPAMRRADVLWLEKEALPWLPWQVERSLLPRDVPLVSDYDDAVFHSYDMHASAIVRATMGRKIDRVMRASRLVMAGNDYLAERARAAGARDVQVVPSVVDTGAYRPAPRASAPAGGLPVIGWVGSPSTWNEYVEPLAPVLAQVVREGRARFAAMGGGRRARAHDWVEAAEWSEGAEPDFLAEIDIGIMPVADTPWARGKCGFKLIQYLACGIPAVASPVGVNRDIVVAGETGILAGDHAQWAAALHTLVDDGALRQRMGQAGRRRMVEGYSLEKWGPLVADMLWEAGQTR